MNEKVLKSMFSALMTNAHVNLVNANIKSGSRKSDKTIQEDVIKIYDSYFHKFDFSQKNSQD